MAYTARQLYVIRRTAQEHPAHSPLMRDWIKAVNENVDWPTTTTTTTTTSSTTSTTSSSSTTTTTTTTA
jgi:hypothetical protein